MDTAIGYLIVVFFFRKLFSTRNCDQIFKMFVPDTISDENLKLTRVRVIIDIKERVSKVIFHSGFHEFVIVTFKDQNPAKIAVKYRGNIIFDAEVGDEEYVFRIYRKSKQMTSHHFSKKSIFLSNIEKAFEDLVCDFASNFGELNFIFSGKKSKLNN